MVETTQVHELVNEHVVRHPVRHENQTPVQTDVSVPSARTPSGPLVSDTHLARLEPMLARQTAQPRRQHSFGTRAPAPFLIRLHDRRGQPGALLRDPITMALDEGLRLSARPTSENRDAGPAIALDTKQVAPGATVANEVDRCDGTGALRCDLTASGRCRHAIVGCSTRRRRERQSQLHGIQDSLTNYPLPMAM